MTIIPKEILEYNNSQVAEDKAICELLATEITKYLFEADISPNLMQTRI